MKVELLVLVRVLVPNLLRHHPLGEGCSTEQHLLACVELNHRYHYTQEGWCIHLAAVAFVFFLSLSMIAW